MRIASWILVVGGVLTGCGPDLGECDVTAAKAVVYNPEGIPYYEGQALVRQSCAGSFCHAAGATGEQRKGVQHGLNFDVATANSQSRLSDVLPLRKGVAEIRDDAEDLYGQVESGAMPPGDEGKAARASIAWRRSENGVLVDAALPDVSSNAGKEVLRNWLACAAPVVSVTDDAPPDVLAEASEFGDVRPPAGTSVQPTFESIYANVFTASCMSCHVSGGPYSSVQAVEFDTRELAHSTLVGADPFDGGECDGRGELVTPGDCEGSLLYQKLLPEGEMEDPCGSPMPLGDQPVSAETLDAICEWIDMGATL
jgi:hypothetical protein